MKIKQSIWFWILQFLGWGFITSVINLSKINNVTPWFNGKLKIKLNNGLEVETSRRQALKFREKLEF